MKRSWLIATIAGLVLGVAALGTALAVVVAEDGGSADAAGNDQYAGCPMGWGMMAGRGDWTPESMRAYMQGVLGEEGYQDMLEHMRAHLDGEDTDAYAFPGPMHQMMDAMASGWSEEDWDRCWGWMTR